VRRFPVRHHYLLLLEETFLQLTWRFGKFLSVPPASSVTGQEAKGTTVGIACSHFSSTVKSKVDSCEG
jgi:hypothetical protein